MPESDRLLIGYQQAVADVRARVMNYANAIWGGLPAFRDAQAERLIARLVPMVTAGQLQVANLTSSYIARAVSGGVPLPVDRDGVTRGRGVDPELLYRRPFEQVWADLSESAPLDAAVAAGATRLMHLVATDMQMAKVRQADASLQAAGVKAYRRVLNGPKNCALCVIASTQRYHVGDLSPIHPGCDCSVAPVKSDWNGDRVIDPDLLEDTHKQVRELTGADNRAAHDYQKLLLVRDHGEIGPVLTWRDQNFKAA